MVTKQYADAGCVYAVALTILAPLMNAIARLFLSALLVLSVHISAHSQTVTLRESLRWSDLDRDPSNDDQGFEGAVFQPDRVDYPIFSKRIPLGRFKSVNRYTISAEEVTSLPENLRSAVQDKAPTSEFEVSVRTSNGGSDYYLIVEVIPVRLRNGRLERLLSFQLNIELSEGSPVASRTLQFASSSALSTGSWYKIAIARDGVYRMDRSFLSQLGIDVDALDPRTLNVYGNGGSMLPESNLVDRADDLVRNSIFVNGEADGSFDNGDYILFYGKGPDTWRQAQGLGSRATWRHTRHYYSDSAYYFIRTDDIAADRIVEAPSSSDPATVTVNTFQDYQYIENETYNLAQSGREFFGDKFDVTLNASYTFNAPNATADSMLVEAQVAVRSIGQNSTFNFTSFGATASTTPSAVFDSPTSRVASIGTVSLKAIPTNANLKVDVSFVKGNADAAGWIDFIRVNYMRNLTLAGNQLRFRNSQAVGAGAVAEYQIGGATAVFKVWDVTDPLHPVGQLFELSGSSVVFRSSSSSLREFIAFTNSGYLIPTPKGAVSNQNLHALSDVQYVIVSSAGHLENAKILGQHHADRGMTVAVVAIEQVFNEFSSGNPDPVAVRMLMKMLYDRAAGDEQRMPRNLLLFGDGDYAENKGLESQLGFNVMVYESEESLSPTSSYVSDDYFVFLSDDDDASASNLLDCGVGRIPARNPTEATQYINKVKVYQSSNTSSNGGASCLGDEAQTPYGAWRNLLTFVSDDQDGNGGAFEAIHLVDSDTLAGRMSVDHPAYDIRKIYMDAYRQVSTPGGERYPEGAAAIKEVVQNGSLVVCYVGHGGERGWAHERILDIPTIQGWTNLYTMPLFLTATCELARYDNPDFHSAGELLVLNPNGGAIGMLTTTRIVFSGSNFQIDTAFYSIAFDDDRIANLDFGRINMLTKNGVPQGNSSKANFTLLGDPAVKLVYPKHSVVTEFINDISLASFVDTLKALQEVEFKGYVADASGNKLTDFNGFVYPTVYDKKRLVNTLNNDGGIVQTYSTFDKVIYKGAASVVNGDFKFKFVVPFDINYSVANARVSYYGVAGDRDAHGYNQDFKIGSIASDATLNRVGPEIELFMNDTTFVSGGLTNTEPLFLAKLKDENGINTVGNGVGHDLVAYLDGNTQDPIVLNQYYRSDLDTYQSGEVRYQLNDLAPGEHTLRMRAWDVHNNSNEQTLSFLVAESADMALRHVLNYPNPFTTNTKFFFEHNQACETLDVRIQIFTVSGKLVKTLYETVKQTGFRSEPMVWDGLDDFGDRIGKGTYVYRLEARTADGKHAEEYQKLVILK